MAIPWVWECFDYEAQVWVCTTHVLALWYATARPKTKATCTHNSVNCASMNSICTHNTMV